MCLYCHIDDPEFDTNPEATYVSVHAKAHGDNDDHCMRVQPDNSYICFDCKFVAVDEDAAADHVCEF